MPQPEDNAVSRHKREVARFLKRVTDNATNLAERGMRIRVIIEEIPYRCIPDFVTKKTEGDKWFVGLYRKDFNVEGEEPGYIDIRLQAKESTEELLNDGLQLPPPA